MRTLIISVFSAYLLTLIIVNSALFLEYREKFKKHTEWLAKGNPLVHPVDCRLCTGFWVSIVIAILIEDPFMFPVIYGISYFMATQERT